MADPKLIDDLAQRAGVSRADAEAVLEALGSLAPDRLPPPLRPPIQESGPAPSRFVPTAEDVEALIAEARKHALGLEFLLTGDLSAVAVTFRVHAFTVDAARQRLTGHPQ